MTRRTTLGLLTTLAAQGCFLLPEGEPFPVQGEISPETVTIPRARRGAPPQYASFVIENLGGSSLYVSPATSDAKTVRNDPVDDAFVEVIDDKDVAALLTVDLPAFSQVAPGQRLPLELTIDARTWRWQSGSYVVRFPFEFRYFYSGQRFDEPETVSNRRAPTPVAEIQHLEVAFEIDCDVDRDGYDAVQCGGEDCNDDDASIHPEADERCDGKDRNCNGAIDDYAVDRIPFYLDADGDTWGGQRVLACRKPSNAYVQRGGDCDDDDDQVYPGAPEGSCPLP